MGYDYDLRLYPLEPLQSSSALIGKFWYLLRTYGVFLMQRPKGIIAMVSSRELFCQIGRHRKRNDGNLWHIPLVATVSVSMKEKRASCLMT
ncbi:jg17399 [Pararge aegeria aegeria]|uniref:Jg17399 protein n=1 Tax=Pararge aegeria aegeria TaxID=348720 RepID=A0A8S4S0H0_9NEOP|nr:jg17399 [Pararge aegeria aegeria]